MDSSTFETAFKVIEENGSEDYIGEAVSQITHALQAAYFAEHKGYPIEMITAAFFHDIGHMLQGTEQMGVYGVKNHEKLAAVYLRDLKFPEYVIDVVENHVNAKRYLVSKTEGYYEKLSDASKNTLKFQGGPMNQEELEEFEKRTNFKDFIKMRELDELAKETELKTPDLAYYKEKIIKYLVSAQN
jgi:2-amino-1-hydroxyethylphosphonate dioxygenase (glycine-forming)